MDVFVANEQKLPVDEARSASLARHALQMEDVDDQAELSILYIGSDHIKNLNDRYAGNSYATDVLAFPLMDEVDDAFMMGDVVICPEVAQTNAERAGRPLQDELDLLLVHGTLHLLGYDHQRAEDGAKMEARITEILSSFHPRRLLS
jgi:probable rRNA maturation factor